MRRGQLLKPKVLGPIPIRVKQLQSVVIVPGIKDLKTRRFIINSHLLLYQLIDFQREGLPALGQENHAQLVLKRDSDVHTLHRRQMGYLVPFIVFPLKRNSFFQVFFVVDVKPDGHPAESRVFANSRHVKVDCAYLHLF